MKNMSLQRTLLRSLFTGTADARFVSTGDRQVDANGAVVNEPLRATSLSGSSHKCTHNSILSRSATPWEEAADVLVPANQR